MHFFGESTYALYLNCSKILFTTFVHRFLYLVKESQFEGLSMSWIKHYAIQILQGLMATHKSNIIHCDLKPENLMFVADMKRPNYRIKIIDYGSSCYTNEKFYSYIQSRFYRAPEVILGMPYSNKIDIWSFGCILVELYLGLPIFPGNSMYDQLKKITNILGY
jgi:serine/threonine protein kinase